jgi:glutamate-ammonia-ligase adenylyltransferase
MEQLNRLAELIDSERARALASDLGGRPLAVLLGTAFPPLTPQHAWQLEALDRLAERGWRAQRRHVELVRALDAGGPAAASDAVMPFVRQKVWAEKARIALRELLPVELGGAELDSTAYELSLLADAALGHVLREAMREVEARSGPPMRADGERSSLAVFGMGKLGGLELNAGSDIDLLFVYDTDEGASGLTLHEHWTAVVRRLVELVETTSADGAIWRVDLRLRPEGSTGAIVNSADATERYYTRWGRLWERAALLRARPTAGDLRLGLLLEREIMHPFVYRRQVDPGIAAGLAELVARSRAELSPDPARDLKLGRGGIREAEFFVQTLQLVWGGREPSLKTRGTLSALSRLRSRGLVSDDEATSVSEAYVLLRKLEHRVQWMSGVQTHLLPQGDDLTRLAATLRVDEGSLLAAVARAREVVHRLFTSLAPGPVSVTKPSSLVPVADLLVSRAETLDRAARDAFGSEEIGEHLRALARRPDGLLGELTRERYPGLVLAVLDELKASSDPEHAAEGLRAFFGRFLSPEPYVAALASQRLGLRRLVTAFASGAFIRDAVLARPELADLIVFGEAAISDPAAAVEIEIEGQAQIQAAGGDAGDGRDALVSGLRIAKQRVMVEVATADLAGALSTREATRHLAALADAELDSAVRHALGTGDGLAVIAMGKLGGREIGYGSDLDVLFVYDPRKAPDEDEASAWFSYKAQAIIRLISEPHVAGPGYELDTRLRPSGSQGMLVTSIEAFARYHSVPPPGVEGKPSGVGSSGASWERQALLRARFCAGDPELGARALRIAEQAAYGGRAPDSLEIHHLRSRMERELAREREDRFDLKAGRGGLFDVEFAVQFLQMRNGADTRVRTPDTAEALEALATLGHVRAADYEALREGYRFLRRLEQRIHVQRGRGSSTLDTRDPGLRALAHRMGYRDGPGLFAVDALLARYKDVTENVRAAYRRVLGIPEP